MDYVAAVGGTVYAQREQLAGFKVKCYATIKYRTLFLDDQIPVGDYLRLPSTRRLRCSSEISRRKRPDAAQNR